MTVTKISPICGRFGHRHHPEAIHHRFQGRQRIDLGDDHVGAHAARPHRQAAPAPAIAGDDEILARQQDIGGADDAVDGGLAGAVAVIEEVLGHGIVDGDDREGQRAIGRHGAQADHAGGGLFGAADHVLQQVAALLVQRADQVGAVVHGDVGLVIQGGVDMLVIGDVVLALDGKDRDLEMRHQRRRHIILGGERVGGGQHHIRAAQVQGVHQVGGLGGHVQAGGDAHPLQRALLGKALADQAQDGHLPLGPFDAPPAAFGQLDISNIIIFHAISPIIIDLCCSRDQ